ncbi:MAG: hypothetical protein PHH59_03135 [Methylovulum sp.]|uniref:hypothetical protein n=1 Tax=Methylovulum sp. TaxID=1916980 RepID=UPI00261319C7|nr:hypothetical protein [Methylovulum sp.]MDD2723001.1 hypothetical protein [Methylovulum sp.]
MISKFANVPVDQDTTIIAQCESKFDCYPVLYQKWIWDGIAAESIIFANEDIPDLTDEELENEVKSSPIFREKSQITIKKTDGFTFVNFNFDVL